MAHSSALHCLEIANCAVLSVTTVLKFTRPTKSQKVLEVIITPTLPFLLPSPPPSLLPLLLPSRAPHPQFRPRSSLSLPPCSAPNPSPSADTSPSVHQVSSTRLGHQLL